MIHSVQSNGLPLPAESARPRRTGMCSTLARSPSETVRVRGDPKDVHIAGADFHEEQAVQALEGHRVVHTREVGGQHSCDLRGRNCRQVVSVPRRRGRDLQGLEDPPDCGCANLVTELEQLALDPLVPQPWFSVASRSISAARTARSAQSSWGPRIGATQDGDRMPKHQLLGVLGC
jgi:hypothetical protein